MKETHLSPQDLIDLAEGFRDEWSAPHLRGCGTCQRELAELRRVMSVVAEVAVPEPSPLFWDHLSRRVREAVAADEGLHKGSWLGGWSLWKVAPLSALAVAALVAALVFSLP